MVSFTLLWRRQANQVISARAMHRKERLRYEQELKSLPKFRSEAEERQFWETDDSSEYIEQG
jgi:hypothetical protein